MGCEIGRSLRGFALVVVSVIMAEALLLLGDCYENNRHLNYSQLTSRFIGPQALILARIDSLAICFCRFF